ncbi:MAG TPA: 23S rRNA (pseudouridine(1915)-N(3))-methyltransferase RlmH [Casimicrobiaceae bacterium]|nr:23S rRNA (pseudouridine(1915)-N(3))-methyltransferase RlmH [Casimicrobiaceae bacterium]
MRLRIVALSHRTPAWATAAYSEYAKRLPPDWPLDLVELKPQARDRGRSTAQVLAAEAQRIATVCTGYRSIALDERGASWTTRQLADRLRRHRDNGEDLAFVIGSADGLHDDIKRAASALFSLSALTLPHIVCRVILAEQLYRAYSLATGHPYHRD